MTQPAASQARRSHNERSAIVAAALAWAPIGFALGAFAAARSSALGATQGGAIAAAALLGAFALAALAAGVATRLPAKPLRIATVVAGGVSFALIVYLVRDFVVDRMRQAEAFDAAYARMAPFQLRIASNDANRRPFSVLLFDSTTRAYTAHRPGGWLCRGSGRREHALALSRGLQQAAREEAAPRPPGAHCPARVSWRDHTAASTPLAEGALDHDPGACAPQALLLAADGLVAGTARRASCRRHRRPSNAEPAATNSGAD